MSDQNEKARRIVEKALDNPKEGNEAEADKKIDEADSIDREATEKEMDIKDDATDQDA